LYKIEECRFTKSTK